MKNFSEETIEVNGVEYTLFLNRKGVVAWERDAKEWQEELQNVQNKYSNLELESRQKEENDNPFEGLDDVDNLEEAKKLTNQVYESLYRIMLYTHHPLNRTEAHEWYENAISEYGDEQILNLAVQMLQDANDNKVSKETELKKLKALRQAK